MKISRREWAVFNIIKELNVCDRHSSYKVEERLFDTDYRNDFCVYHGATKICLVNEHDDFIVKWSHCKEGEDEGLKEVELYKKAKAIGLDMFFPETKLLGEVNDINVISQKKYDFSAYAVSNDSDYEQQYKKYEKITKTVTDKIYHKMYDGFHYSGGYCLRPLDRLWAEMCISIYGKKLVKKLCKFIEDNKINDLHSENIGYLNNKPIIIDFGGYSR